jgi:hypothetical protein
MLTLRIAITELAIVALGSALTVAGHVWALQQGYRTYSILVVGLALVTVASVWAVRRAIAKLGLPRWKALIVTGCWAGFAALWTLWISMAVLLNVYGS